MLAIALGVSLYVSSSTMLEGFREHTINVLSRYRIDVTVQEGGKASPIKSRLRIETAEELTTFPGVAEATPVVFELLRTKFSPYFLLVGLPSGEWVTANVRLVAGRAFKAGTDEVMLGSDAAKKLRLQPGSVLRLPQDRNLPVVGIYSTGHPMLDGAAALDIDVAQKLLRRDSGVNMVLLRAQNADAVGALAYGIAKAYPDLSAVSRGSTLQHIQAFVAIEHISRAISLIGLLTCMLVAANTLTMTVIERTREIGILAACGWSPQRIVLLLLSEAAILGIGGGLLGLAMAEAVIKLVDASQTLGIGWVPDHPDAKTALTALLLAGGAALVGALLPAWRGARIDPSEAVRHE